jgi:S1-C subfamily serine protease
MRKIIVMLAASICLLFSGLLMARPDINDPSLYNYLSKSVYYAYDSPLRNSGGTGFAIRTHDGKVVIVSNSHVCDNNPEMWLGQDDNPKLFVSKVIKKDPEKDLCMMTAPKDAVPLPLAPVAPKQFEEILVIGHPHLEPITPAFGHILVLHRAVQIMASGPACGVFTRGVEFYCEKTYSGYLSEAKILPGNSGSPVFNSTGQVIGVAFISTPVGSLFINFESLNKFLE